MIGAVTPTALRPGLYGLTVPVALAIGTVNLYVIDGDPLTLIDAGTNNDETFAAIEAGLAALGHQISDVRRLIITHHHTDHSGGAGRIAEAVRAAGAELHVLSHPHAVAHLEDPVTRRATIHKYADRIFGVEGGATEKQRRLMAEADDYLLTLVDPVHVTGTLEEGDIVLFNGEQWRVYLNPGHAADQITFFQPESRAWIAADHLLGNSKSNPLVEPPEHHTDPRPKRLIEYERELLRMDALAPSIAYAGHGEPITEVHALIAERITRRRIRTEKLFELIQAAAPADRTLGKLSWRLFPNTTDMESYLVFSETLGHLDILEASGRIIPVTGQTGVVRWELGTIDR